MAELKVFSGSSSHVLAKKVCDLMGTQISPLEINVFSDGEKRIRAVESVLEKDCVVISSTAIPVDQNYMELFFIIDALRRSGAKSITLVMPYFGYQRQDHIFRDGEAVSLGVIVKILEDMGVTRLISLDLHSVKIPQFFKIPVTHLSALPLFAKEIGNWKLEIGNSCLVSPDLGGIARISKIAELTGLPFCSIEKNRDLVSGKVTADKIDGEVLENAIIVDDIIASGKTIVSAVDLLISHGAKNINVFAAHPVFSDKAAEILQESQISKVVVTDSIEIPENKKFSKLEVISVADMIAKELKTTSPLVPSN